jgi:hypothetical protein
MSDTTAVPAWDEGCSECLRPLPRQLRASWWRVRSLVRVCECCASGTLTKKCPSIKAFLHFVRLCELNLRSSESRRDISKRAYSRKDGIGRRRRFHSHTHTTLQMCLCRSDFFVCVSKTPNGELAQNTHTHALQSGPDLTKKCSVNSHLGAVRP